MQGENRKKADQREEEVPKKGPAREPGTNQGLKKTSREEIRNTPNRTGKEVEPEQGLKEKKGLSYPPAPRPDARDGSPEHRALGQAEDCPNPQVHKPRPFKARGVEDRTSRKQTRY